jgi:hypothetical protein
MSQSNTKPRKIENRAVSEELARMGFGELDPGYVGNLRTGARKNGRVTPEVIEQAIQNLISQG